MRKFFSAVLLLVLTVAKLGTVSLVEAEEALEVTPSVQKLIDGHERYLNEETSESDISKERREELADGQEPFAVVITCSDSRVSPEYLFDLGLGELFVVRVAGNILDEAELGSVEYAIAELGADTIVVLGHESCGAVTTAVAKDLDPEAVETTQNIDAFLDNIEPAVKEARQSDKEDDELVELVADLNVANAMKQLETDSNIIKDAVKDQSVSILGAKYLLEDGDLQWFNQ